MNDSTLVPNFKFAAPEITNEKSKLTSVQGDMFSVGCVLYYLVALNSKNANIKSPYVLNMLDASDSISHRNECNSLAKRLNSLFSSFDNDLEIALRSLIIEDPSSRASLN